MFFRNTPSLRTRGDCGDMLKPVPDCCAIGAARDTPR